MEIILKKLKINYTKERRTQRVTIRISWPFTEYKCIGKDLRIIYFDSFMGYHHIMLGPRDTKDKKLFESVKSAIDEEYPIIDKNKELMETYFS